MVYLLDTCVLSEPRQKEPRARVLDFLRELRPMDGFVSVVALAEIWKGIELLPHSKRRKDLTEWFEGELLVRFAGRVLPVDLDIALRQGALAASLIAVGRTMPIFDSFVAATALVHDLTLVTRNEGDFVHAGVHILNPWK
jgi:predicted nucleic acid-binding protein